MYKEGFANSHGLIPADFMTTSSWSESMRLYTNKTAANKEIGAKIVKIRGIKREVNSIKMLAASKGKVVSAIKSGKVKTACLMVGITLTLFYNLPFELWNISVSKVLLFIATILSVISGVQYYSLNKYLIKDK